MQPDLPSVDFGIPAAFGMIFKRRPNLLCGCCNLLCTGHEGDVKCYEVKDGILLPEPWLWNRGHSADCSMRPSMRLTGACTGREEMADPSRDFNNCKLSH